MFPMRWSQGISMQSRPWSVQVEFVQGCDRLCPFCGLNAIRDAPGSLRLMTMDTLDTAMRGFAALCPDARFEVAMHGEPLLHPKRLAMLSRMRRWVPRAQIQVTTNGAWLKANMRERVPLLFAAGVDFIVLDTYEPDRRHLQVQAWRCVDVFTVLDFYKDCVSAKLSPWHNHGRKLRNTVIVMDDLAARNGEVKSRTIVNHAGSNPQAPPLAAPRKATCTNPFREMSVCWNGDVCACCMDWKHEQVVGNVNQDNVRDIWLGDRFEAVRAMLSAKDRGMAPCVRCDRNAGARSGLLPKYPPPTLAQRKLVGA